MKGITKEALQEQCKSYGSYDALYTALLCGEHVKFDLTCNHV